MTFSSLVAIFTYVGVAYGLMCLGKTCGLERPWLSWIPFANTYQLGRVADEYTIRRERHDYKIRIRLLVTKILIAVVSIVLLVLIVSWSLGIIQEAGINLLDPNIASDAELLAEQLEDYLMHFTVEEQAAFLSDMMLHVLLPCLVLLALSVVYIVFYGIAVYRIFKLFVPEHAAGFTALCIIFNSIASPIIFLVIANKPVRLENTVSQYDNPPPTFGGNTNGDSDTYYI